MASNTFFSKDATTDLDATIDQLVGPDSSDYTPTPKYGSIGYLGIPAIVGLFLYFFQPKFVMMTKNGKQILCRRRLALWTLIISFVLCAACYFYLSSGYSVPSLPFMKGI